jgi:hypothetical protein
MQPIRPSASSNAETFLIRSRNVSFAAGTCSRDVGGGTLTRAGVGVATAAGVSGFLGDGVVSDGGSSGGDGAVGWICDGCGLGSLCIASGCLNGGTTTGGGSTTGGISRLTCGGGGS